jgi:hypothetical protein
MSSCNCNYLKKTVCNAGLYGTLKVATTKVVGKAPKKDNDVLTQKVSSGKMRNEILMDVAAYGAAQYGWWYLAENAMSYQPEMFADLPINLMEDLYKAGIITLIDAARGKATINSFIHELLLVGATDFTFKAIDSMDSSA